MKLTDEEIEREVRMTDKQYEEYKKAKEELEPVHMLWRNNPRGKESLCIYVNSTLRERRNKI